MRLEILNVNDAMLARLTPREEKVIKMLLAKTRPETICEHFVVSQERLNQIIARAFRKLIHHNLKTNAEIASNYDLEM